MKFTEGGLYFEDDASYTTSTIVKPGEYYTGTSNPSGGTFMRYLVIGQTDYSHNHWTSISIPMAASSYSNPRYVRSGAVTLYSNLYIEAKRGGYRLA